MKCRGHHREKPKEYMIDTRTISKERPSPEEIERNRWQSNEMKLIGLMIPYDGDFSSVVDKKLTQFKSPKEYEDALAYAMELLDQYKPVPEPLRTKLILEEKSIHKQEQMNKKRFSTKELAKPIVKEDREKAQKRTKLLNELGIETYFD